MEAHARAPDPLTGDGDMANNWRSWKEDFIIFMKVTGYIHNLPKETRANLLKNRIGKIGINVIQNMSFENPDDKDDMDILIARLDAVFDPPKKEVVERYQFFSRSKKQNESIEQYINILKEKAKTCNFNDMTDGIIRDKIILDTHDKILRQKFFEADNLDLQKLAAIYNDYSINIEKMKQVTKENIQKSESSTQKQPAEIAKKNTGCWRCGTGHPIGKCPASGSKCTNCNKINHFTHCCKGPGSNPKANNEKVNKNLFDSSQQKTHASKSNEKWNNQADSGAKSMDPMNQMINLPDIPTISSNAVNSDFCSDSVSDYVMIDPYNTSTSLRHFNIKSQSTPSPTNSQYNYSYAKGTNKINIYKDACHNEHERIRSNPAHASTSQSFNKTSKNPSIKIKPSEKKSDEDSCKLS